MFGTFYFGQSYFGLGAGAAASTVVVEDVRPIPAIRWQAHTTTPVTGDATLVDDPVALVDDLTALSGGQTSSIPVGSIGIRTVVPRPAIKISR